jgi:hypothetical protein
MAFTGEFLYFNELGDDLKFNIVEKISGTKEFLRLIASGKTHGLSIKEVQTKLRQLQRQDYVRVISILHHFTTECLGMERKFLTDDNVRNTHLDLFVNGYAHSELLQDNENFEEYNYTFQDLVEELASTLRDPQDHFSIQNKSSSMEIVNKLRFRQDLKDSAKQALFKQVEDYYVQHQLVVEFESGIKMDIEITIFNTSDYPMPSIDVNTSFVTKNSKKLYNHKYVVSGENEDYDEEDDEEDDDGVESAAPRWINNDPTGWIVTVMKKLKRKVGQKSNIGRLVIKNIDYKYIGFQFWAKAYFILEVLPKLASM